MRLLPENILSLEIKFWCEKENENHIILRIFLQVLSARKLRVKDVVQMSSLA